MAFGWSPVEKVSNHTVAEVRKTSVSEALREILQTAGWPQ